MKTILLVEDNSSDEKLALLAFRSCGVVNQIVVQRDGAAALDYLFGEPTAELPALVLLDLKLPRLDGFDVLRRIRADRRTRLLPVVILTASNEEEDIAQSYSLGANAYVRKPVSFDELIEAARSVCRFWLLLNERPPPVVAGT